jgi:hydrogenase 3 maturation protease
MTIGLFSTERYGKTLCLGAYTAMGVDKKLVSRLKALRGTRTVILGIGNTLKGDDGVGPLVCQRLTEGGAGADVFDAGTVPENYIQPIIKKTPQNLVIIDAVDFGAAPGTIKLFEPEQLSTIGVSTHAPTPRLFIDIIKKSIEVGVYFIGIQPAQTQIGQPITPQLTQAAEDLASLLLNIFPSSF